MMICEKLKDSIFMLYAEAILRDTQTKTSTKTVI